MQPNFGIERERHNQLYYKEYTNDNGKFHFHSPIELYMITDGQMEVWVNNHRKILKAGEMSVALSYDAHAYRTVEHSKSCVLIIPSYLCEEFINAVQHKRVSTPFVCDEETVATVRHLAKEIQKDPTNKIKVLGYIYVILGTLMEHITFEEAEESTDPALSSRILFYLGEHFREEITTAELATALGYSPSYLSRYFKACFHIGIHQYLTIIRLKHAIMLLHEGQHNITFCAMESGFSSMRTFYRSFEKEFGCAPKEYRKQKETV